MNEQPLSDRPAIDSKRISITKTQSQSEAGIELVALCQTITEDGSLSNDEVRALGDWLTQHSTSDLPAVSFLTEAVRKIVADGRITDEERNALHEAVETILPNELRRRSKAKRLELRKLERAKTKLEKQLALEHERSEAKRNSPIESYDFMVAGAHIGGRPIYINAYASAGEPVEVALEPTNKYSRNAVQVILKDRQIGYVPEEDARELAPLLKAGNPYMAEIKKILTSGRSPRPVVVLDVFDSDARFPGLKSAGVRKSDEGLSILSKIILAVVAAAVLYILFR
jgi:hypothetical protein